MQIERSADECVVRTEQAAPGIVAEHERAGAAIGGGEGPPVQRHAEHFEELRGRRQPAQPMAAYAVDDVERAPAVAGDGVERRRLPLPVDQRPAGRARERKVVQRAVAAEGDETVAVAVGERAKQQRLADAEDGRRPADAEREHQHRRGDEDAVATEVAEGAAKVLEQVLGMPEREEVVALRLTVVPSVDQHAESLAQPAQEPHHVSPPRVRRPHRQAVTAGATP